ncbi:MAG: aminodeoxychorismate synthase component I [Halioglobus sp.]
MKTLLIDNYDSFTFNLFQIIAEVNRIPPIVVRNDRASWDEIKHLDFDNIVVSPGPGRPENESDFGVCKDVILQAEVPILGVCLGHQGICHLFGGEVDYAETVMHGRPSDIIHQQTDIFRDIPSPYSAIRYHSLYVKKLSPDMEAIAHTEDGMIMGARHKSKPIWSVQFHPESIKTEYGHQLLENFRSLTAQLMKEGAIPERERREINEEDYNIMHRPAGNSYGVGGGNIHGKQIQVHYRRIALTLSAEDIFVQHFADSPKSYWLDSALVRGFSRFSYMGDASGPHAEYITYSQPEQQVTVQFNGETTVTNETIFDYLNRELKERRIDVEGLPFDFNLGYAGYFGYELKGDCGYDTPYTADTPDAAFVFADRLIAFDHEENIAYLVCLDDTEHPERAKQWLDEMQEKLKDVPKAPNWSRALHPKPVEQTFRHDAEAYLDRIKASQAEIKKGETYEVCLTNMITQHVKIDPLNTYRALRRSNPAPYATYLHFPDVAVMSSSPERFITVDANGVVESKPIKGTRKRGKSVEEDEALHLDLSTNEKDRSENLMIVDLLRNDIGQLSDVGSVHVSQIFAVESYATVHQLVSTVRGRLRRDASSIDCIRACFPGGSMTGAPKKRTMEIVDRLEGGARGVYSGSIGFLGLNGSADLSIVIRTIVQTDKDVTVGVGGAIIDLSDPQDELDEMILKSQALVSALSETNLDTE